MNTNPPNKPPSPRESTSYDVQLIYSDFVGPDFGKAVEQALESTNAKYRYKSVSPPVYASVAEFTPGAITMWVSAAFLGGLVGAAGKDAYKGLKKFVTTVASKAVLTHTLAYTGPSANKDEGKISPWFSVQFELPNGRTIMLRFTGETAAEWPDQLERFSALAGESANTYPNDELTPIVDKLDPDPEAVIYAKWDAASGEFVLRNMAMVIAEQRAKSEKERKD